jgi:hypothetical protein
MSTILDLSLELVFQILQSLSTPDLASFSKTCQSLHAITEPILYESVSWTFDRDEEEYEDQSILLFLRSILRRPVLADHVKKINLRCISSFYDGDNEEPYEIALSANDCDTICGTLAEERFTFQEEVGEAIWNNSLDAFITFLISRLHSLEILEIGFGLVRISKFLGMILESDAKNALQGHKCIFTFERLKEVHFTAERDHDSLIRPSRGTEISCRRFFDLIAGLFHITSLETIDVVLPEPEMLGMPFTWPPNSLPPSNLTTLHLRHSHASVATLRKLLLATPKLSTLQYDFVQDVDDLYQGKPHYGEWAQLTRALRTLSSTLKDLTISVDYHIIDDYKPEDWDEDWIAGVWSRRGRMGSLRDFTKLERLEVPLPVLLGWEPPGQNLRDVLPSSLRHLCLRDDLFDTGDYLWTPWRSFVVGAELDQSYQDTLNAEHVLSQLRGYLNVGDNNRHEPLPDEVCLKFQHKRLWPRRALDPFERMCRDAGILGKVEVRMGSESYFERENCDLVEEVVLWNPKRPDEGGESSFVRKPLMVLQDHR